jgi:prepilin peptidase CpaA
MPTALTDPGSGVAALMSLATVSLLALAAWFDIGTRTIPDCIPVALVLIGIAVRIQVGVAAAATSLGVGVLVFLLLALVHARGMLGGGDVKLMASMAVQLPPDQTVALVAATSIAGGALALLHLAMRLLPAPSRCPAGAARLRRMLAVERWRVRRHGSLPYGVAIACGGVWTILSVWGA